MNHSSFISSIFCRGGNITRYVAGAGAGAGAGADTVARTGAARTGAASTGAASTGAARTGAASTDVVHWQTFTLSIQS